MTYINMKSLQDNYYEIGFPELNEEQIKLRKNATFSFSGKLNRADAMGMNLIHWYSINLINYVKCCGLVKFLNKTGYQPQMFMGNKDAINELRICQNEYLDSIPEIQSIKHFRNKASAHLAYTDPKKHDNPGTLVESMSIIPTLNNGKFTIGSMKRKKGDFESSFGNYECNLVDNFDSLIPRYFKDSFN